MRSKLVLVGIIIGLAFSSCRKNEDHYPEFRRIDSLFVSLPTAFSPEPSKFGLNNEYLVLYNYGYYRYPVDSQRVFVKGSTDPINKFEMKIRDDENNLVFKSNNIKEGWNGSYKGKPMPTGKYFVTAHFEGINGGSETYSEKINLLR
jgi:hypothetical protein